MTGAFDTVAVVDWSASAVPSPARPTADAIWIGTYGAAGAQAVYLRTRTAAEATLAALIAAEQAAGRRLLIGFDFAMGYPVGFAKALTTQSTARAVWQWLAATITDGPDNANNRFAVAQRINAMFPQAGPFWGRPGGLDLPDLPARKTVDYRVLGFAEKRRVEGLVPRAQPVWKLFTTGAVGSQALMGLPMIARLSARAGVTVWPFAPGGDVVLAEVYPSLIDPAVAVRVARGEIKDRAQVRLLARSLHRLARDGSLQAMMADVPDGPERQEEGWILGAGHSALLQEALA